MSEGLFITFEGIEGSGKTTQFNILAERLSERGLVVKACREPGGTAIGDRIRALLLDPDHDEMTAEAEALLYAASRAQLMAEVIDRALGAGETVVCDRFLDSSIAYQVYGRGLPMDFVTAINRRALGRVPDLTFLFDVKPEAGLARATATSADRIEREEIEFHAKVRAGYLALARENSDRFRVLDGAKPVESLAETVFKETDRTLAFGK
ncbi:MAG: dTMP kinase [Candidatus Aquicultorales bacterium]